jgi:adenine specific DNA methylase Mod
MTSELTARMETRIIGIRNTINKIKHDLETGHPVDHHVRSDTLSKYAAYEKHLTECLEMENKRPLWDNLMHNIKNL